MKFTEAQKALELALFSGQMPILVGEKGLGKTSIMKEVAQKFDLELIVIDGCVLKEGELGGQLV